MSRPVRVVVALGSNLGDRTAHLAWAIDALSPHIPALRASSFIESAPVGVPDDQPPYLNAVVVGETDRPARAVLDLLRDLEARRGRTRARPLAPRTLDLDLILYGDAIVDEPGLIVPHPRFRERAFVLQPLVQIAPEMVDPVTGETAAALLEALTRSRRD